MLTAFLFAYAIIVTFIAVCAIWGLVIKARRGGDLVRDIMREFLDDLPPEARARVERRIGSRGGM